MPPETIRPSSVCVTHVTHLTGTEQRSAQHWLKTHILGMSMSLRIERPFDAFFDEIDNVDAVICRTDGDFVAVFADAAAHQRKR